MVDEGKPVELICRMNEQVCYKYKIGKGYTEEYCYNILPEETFDMQFIPLVSAFKLVNAILDSANKGDIQKPSDELEEC